METCRTCAKCDFDNESQWLDLYNSPQWLNETERIHTELNVWKIKISCNDGLPQKICTDCYSKFCTVSAFRLQCLEAQQILSNIFDKIDTQSMQDDDEVFEELEQACEMDYDLTSKTIAILTTATTTTTTTTKSMTTTLSTSSTSSSSLSSSPLSSLSSLSSSSLSAITPSKAIESNLLKSSSKKDTPVVTEATTLNDILNTTDVDNTEVSVPTIQPPTSASTSTQITTEDTARLENDKPSCCNTDHVTDGNSMVTSQNTTAISSTNDLLPEDTNDLDENDLIEELIDELDMIEDLNHYEDNDSHKDCHNNGGFADRDQNQNNINATDADIHCYDATALIDSNEDDDMADNLKISFECKYCYKWKNSATESFQTQQQLLAHITQLHSSEHPYNCPYCGEHFMDAASRTTHLKESHSQKLHSCGTCGKKYADKCNLKNHVEKYHSGADFDCTLCAKSFCSSKSLNYHMKWHNPKEQLKCSYCDRLFINQRHLKCHEETHTGFRNQEVCSFCGKYFFHLKTLRWHIYRQHGGEKPYKCGRCPEVFTSYFEKRLHMLQYHLDNLTLIEKTECMLCHTRYDNENILMNHMLQDHKDNKGSVKIANNKRIIINKKPKSFTGLFHCEKCDKRFNMKSALERHQAVHSTEGRPHACPQCPKRFKRSQDMKWHLKTHSTEKPNVCDVCGKGFALKYVLTQHRRSHEVLEKNFTCSTCGRSYLFEKSLRLHERIHSGKTYYKCDLCSESFVTHIKFKWHMKKMHDEDDVAATNPHSPKNINNTQLPFDDLVNIVIT